MRQRGCRRSVLCARCAAGGTTTQAVSPQTLGAGPSLDQSCGLGGLTPQPLLLGALLGKAAPIPGHPEPWPSECGERAAPRPVQRTPRRPWGLRHVVPRSLMWS